jgi:hypothetical protein
MELTEAGDTNGPAGAQDKKTVPIRPLDVLWREQGSEKAANSG